MTNSYLYLLSTSWRYALKERNKYLWVYFLLIFSNIFISLRPVIYGWFINALQIKGTQVYKDLWIYIALYMGLFFMQWLVHGPARVMERSLAFKISSNFLEDLHDSLLHLPIDWHKDNHTSSTLNRLKKSSAALRDFFQNGFLYLQTIIQLFLSIAAMIYFSVVFGIIAAIIGILTIMVIFLFDKPLLKSLQEFNEEDHKLSSTLSDSLTNIVTVIILRLESQMKSDMLKKVSKMFVPFKKNIVIGENKWFTAGLLVSLIYCIMIVGYVYQNYTPGHTFYIGGLVTLIGFVTQFTNVFFSIAAQYNQIIQYNADVKSANVIKTTYESCFIDAQSEAFPSVWDIIEIKNLNFNYPNSNPAGATVKNSDEPAQTKGFGLADNYLKLKIGKKIALTGPSGSGKSTLLNLVKGLYQPLDGYSVIVNDREGYNWQQIAQVSTLFPQQPEIFENTILYNITMGLPYSDQEIMGACATSCFIDVINNLPEGLDSIIKENGINLSGGQKQRLALARGILASKNSTIILMDESTSNIDQETEAKIYYNLFNLFRNKTIISSVHRTHLVPLFDETYLMKKGTLTKVNPGF